MAPTVLSLMGETYIMKPSIRDRYPMDKSNQKTDLSVHIDNDEYLTLLYQTIPRAKLLSQSLLHLQVINHINQPCDPLAHTHKTRKLQHPSPLSGANLIQLDPTCAAIHWPYTSLQWRGVTKNITSSHSASTISTSNRPSRRPEDTSLEPRIRDAMQPHSIPTVWPSEASVHLHVDTSRLE